MSKGHAWEHIGRLRSNAMNNRTAFAKSPNEWMQIEHNNCSCPALWLWRGFCIIHVHGVSQRLKFSSIERVLGYVLHFFGLISACAVCRFHVTFCYRFSAMTKSRVSFCFQLIMKHYGQDMYMSEKDAKIKFLQLIYKWPTFGSAFFEVKVRFIICFHFIFATRPRVECFWSTSVIILPESGSREVISFYSFLYVNDFVIFIFIYLFFIFF